MTTPVVYVIDDQPAVCHALGELLSVLGYRVETFTSPQTFLGVAAFAPMGCVVSDVRMPGLDGLELMEALRARGVELPVILISGHADVPLAVRAIKAGAEDMIEKPVDDSRLIGAINRALARSVQEQAEALSKDETTRRFSGLTPREMEVFDLVAEGHTSQSIALKLGISVRTVESYRLQIMTKMGATSVAVLVRQAVKLGRVAP